jgi:argininosuccinate lyase
VTLWGGRFESGPGDVLWDYTRDESDRRLLNYDIDGSIAHVTMLGSQGIISPEERDAILEGLKMIGDEASTGSFRYTDDDEDVHTAVERRLFEIIGDAAGKLHTARSRNDQVALDVRLYASEACRLRIAQLHRYAATLADLAEVHAEDVIPSYTHLQQAQATTIGHHLMAYAWMAKRDADRFRDALTRIDVSPLGAAASAGTSLPIDPMESGRLVGMGAVFDNSLDAVGSRDHIAEQIFCSTQAMINLSRLAEEIVIWSTAEFARVRLDDEVTTGSSALPQKRNPDIAELVRGRTARVAGDLMAIIGLQKGLPLSYNRDLQEDKRLLFDADDVLAGSLEAMTTLISHAEFAPAAPVGDTAALDLAETLVARGVPFRQAHHVVGRLLVDLESGGRALGEATFEDLARAHPEFEEDDLLLLDPATSVARRASRGGGGPESVRTQIADLRRALAVDDG